MKIIITLLTIILINFRASADINNIGLFCPYVEKYNTTTGYWFVNGVVEQRRVFGSKIIHYDNQNVTLHGSDRIGFWDKHNPGDFTVYINRKTLIAGSVYKRKCKLIDSKENMLNLMFEDMKNSSIGNKF